MRIEKINNYTLHKSNFNAIQHNKNIENKNLTNYSTNSLEHLAALNKPIFTGKKYDLGLTHNELVKRTDNEHLVTLTMLTPDDPKYLNLAEGDKKALKHLVKAADIIGHIEKQIDDENNLP